MSKPGKNLSKDSNSNCSVCRFWVGPDTSTAVRKGECRRYAPAPVHDELNQESPPWAQWRLTLAHDVCGDFAIEVDL